jgi:hypothetical protein
MNANSENKQLDSLNCNMTLPRTYLKSLQPQIWLKGEGMKTKINFIVVPMLLIAAYMAITNVSVNAWYSSLNIEILSPENNMIYATNSIPLIFTVNKAINETTIWYNLDGQTNVTISGNTTLTDLQDGWHNVTVYAKSKCTCMCRGTVASRSAIFAVDTTPPNITNIHQSPANDSVYPEDEVKVNATVTDDISGVKQVILFYDVNSSGTWIEENMTNLEGDIWNATIPAFLYGTNVTYAISAEDNVGNAIMTAEMEYGIQYQVIPEFSSLIAVPLFMMASLIAIVAKRRRKTTK